MSRMLIKAEVSLEPSGQVKWHVMSGVAGESLGLARVAAVGSVGDPHPDGDPQSISEDFLTAIEIAAHRLGRVVSVEVITAPLF